MGRNDVFRHVVGHDAAKEVLANAIKHPHHGYLFVGLDGAGCHLMAEAFVRALVHHPEDRALTAHPDIAVLAREPSDSGTAMKKDISVRAVRELRMRVSERPSVAERVVAYIPEADHLNEEGVNALLKSVEEPPAGAVFVLVTHQEARIPETLRSRLATLHFGRVPSHEIDAWLEARGIPEPDRVQAVALAEGRPGTALRFVEDSDLRVQMEEAGAIMSTFMRTTELGEAVAAMAPRATHCDAADDPVTAWRKTLQLWETDLRRRFEHAPLRAYGISHTLLMAERHLGGPISPRIWIELGLVRIVQGKPPVFPELLPSTFPYPLS